MSAPRNITGPFACRSLERVRSHVGTPRQSKAVPTASTRQNFRRWKRPQAAAADRDTIMTETLTEEWSEQDLLAWQQHGHPVVEAEANSPPIVVLPGFGNNTQDYVCPFGVEDAGIVATLQRRGFRVFVVDLERRDWFKVARSLLSREYWGGRCTTQQGYDWYLQKVKAAIDTARLETGCEEVDIIAHSAGGWLARAFVADGRYVDESEAGTMGANPCIRSIISLGTPHRPPPPHKMRDMTGGALTWVNENWPGAYFQQQGLNYIAVGGRTVRGNQQAPRKSLSRYAHNSYSTVCGEGHRVEGDCVVPLDSALLEGSAQVVLNGVFHSMSRVGTFGEAAEYVWYGSESVIDTWAHHLVTPPKSAL